MASGVSTPVHILHWSSFSRYLFCVLEFPLLPLYSYLIWQLKSCAILLLEGSFCCVILFLLLITFWMSCGLGLSATHLTLFIAVAHCLGMENSAFSILFEISPHVLNRFLISNTLKVLKLVLNWILSSCSEAHFESSIYLILFPDVLFGNILLNPRLLIYVSVIRL